MAVCSSRMLKWFPFNPSLSEEMERLFAPASDSYDDIMEEFRANGQDSEYCPDSEEELPGTLRGPGSRPRRGKGLGLVLAGSGFMGRALPPPPPPPAVVAQGPGVGAAAALALAMRAPPPPPAAQPPPTPPAAQPATTAASAIANPAAAAAAAAAFALGLLPPPGAGLHCAFCRNNGETVEFYSGHILKDAKGRVQCPILRAYTCPNCGANGDRAHTLKYCPMGAAVAAALEWPSPALQQATPAAVAAAAAAARPQPLGAAGAAKALQAAMAAAPRGLCSKALASASAGGRRRRSFRRSY
ncbi:hypothetical protein R5R35_007793 [Gryllus longicercus]|uniref:Nanos-type domain-containing protein n=1 Tax=Gryllus longicercus TaxID=2509291 RepID=A0AAN9ZA95_9ORTH